MVKRQHGRVNENGSAVTFVVVGLVLAALVVGGIYAVQNRSQKTPSKSPAVVKSTLPATIPSVTPSRTAQPQSSTPAHSPVPTSKPAPSHTPAPTRTPVAVVPHTGTAPLPQTGPSDTIVSALMLATISGMLVAYVRSVRLRLQPSHQVD